MTEHKYHRENYRGPYLATDIIIQYNPLAKDTGNIILLHPHHTPLILITRKNPPLGIALPGGFAEYGISLWDNAKKEAKEETGLDIALDEMFNTAERPFCVHSAPDRDPRAHIIAVTYVCFGYGKLKASDDAASVSSISKSELANLLERNQFAFPDHERALKEYLQRGASYR